MAPLVTGRGLVNTFVTSGPAIAHFSFTLGQRLDIMENNRHIDTRSDSNPNHVITLFPLKIRTGQIRRCV